MRLDSFLAWATINTHYSFKERNDESCYIFDSNSAWIYNSYINRFNKAIENIFLDGDPDMCVAHWFDTGAINDSLYRESARLPEIERMLRYIEQFNTDRLR